MSPTQKLVAPAVHQVIQTAQQTISDSLKIRKANYKAMGQARKLLNKSIFMLTTGPASDKSIVLETLQAVLRELAKVR